MKTQARFFDENDAESLFESLAECRAFLKAHGIESTDVRVQVTDGGSWSLHTGDAQYDTDHRGYWGAGSIVADDDDATLGRTLADLVDQACDHAAENDVCGADGIGMPDTVEIASICRHVAR